VSAIAHRVAPEPPPAPVAFEPRLEHALCILAVAAAVKLPLDVPLYWNAGLLLLGLFALMVVQSLQRIFLSMLALVGLGLVAAALQGMLATSAPRLAQLALLVLAASLIARLDPDRLARWLALLLPVILLAAIAESLLPEPLFHTRRILGLPIHRHGGLQGDPNYSAMLYGTIAVILARYPPRVLALPPLLLALPTLSRGVLAGLALWLVTLALRGRALVRLAWVVIILLVLQPALVWGLHQAVDEATFARLARLSTERLDIWLAYLRMGLSHPLGVGYFQGTELAPTFLPGLGEKQAHSLYLQVFGELGWAGYLPFAAFVLALTRRVARHAPAELPVLIFVLTGYGFVNGLSDWAFWVPVAWLLAKAEQGERAALARAP
jgi:hypothetical protein